MNKKELAKRYILFVVSLFFAALGVAVTKRGELGTSPISSVANVMSGRFEGMTMGVWLIVWNCLPILGQVLLLRRDFQPIQLLQLPLSFLFGWFTDFGLWLAGLIPVESYHVQAAIMGFGVSLAVIADVVMNSGEAFVKAVSDCTGSRAVRSVRPDTFAMMALMGSRASSDTPMSRTPAQQPMMKVSALNTWEMFRLEAPRARRMPISLVRSITEMWVMMPIMMQDTTREMATKAMST